MSQSESPISVSEALQRLDELALDWGVEQVPLEMAAGRVLAETRPADRDFPPFDRVAMDGVAISSAALKSELREFTVIGVQGAGEAPMSLRQMHEAVEVMTGAVLPLGSACVVPVEDLERDDRIVRLKPGAHPRSGDNIHPLGCDAQTGENLLAPGQMLHGSALAVAASIGATVLRVRRRPCIAVLSTGTELVEISDQPAPHQIRVSNLTAIRAGLELDGQRPNWCGKTDDQRGRMLALVDELLAGHDVLVLSGGVSMGRYDHVPGVLAELGCQVLFHGVRQRPGRPLLAALGPTGQFVLGLPGNPVTAVICLHRYLLPLLRQAEGRPDLARLVRLAAAVRWGRPLALFQAARIHPEKDGLPSAHPMARGGSGDFARLVDSHGFLELEEGRALLEPGDTAVFRPWAPG